MEFYLVVRSLVILLAVVLALVLVALTQPKRGSSAAQVAAAKGEKVLIFSKTAGYRHASIPQGNRLLLELAAELGLKGVETEDAAVFTPETLAGVRVIVFNNTSGDVLNAEQEAAFEAWFRGGGAFVGIHAASDTEFKWPFYGEVLGAWFKRHPKIQEATILVEDRTHPSTKHLSEQWVRTDEWYDFRTTPPPSSQVLLRMDEGSYQGAAMGEPHPIAWCQQVHGGRSWYTGLGHTKETYAEPEFRAHLRGGLAWVLEKESD